MADYFDRFQCSDEFKARRALKLERLNKRVASYNATIPTPQPDQTQEIAKLQVTNQRMNELCVGLAEESIQLNAELTLECRNKQKIIDDKQKIIDDKQKIIDDKQKIIDDKQKIIDEKQGIIESFIGFLALTNPSPTVPIIEPLD